MRSLVVGMLALLGCDRVFGLNERAPDAAIDSSTPTDATVSTVESLVVPLAVGTDEIVPATATVRGVPNSSVTCTFTANRGTFAGNDVTVDLDANGVGMASASYRTPGTIGPATVRATVGTTSMTANVDVRTPILVGNDTDFGNGLSVLPTGILFGTLFTLPRMVSLRQVGLRVTAITPGTQARIGVYDANRTLIAATAAVTLVSGRNLFPLLSAQQVPAGPFWIVAVFDRMTTTYGTSIASTDGYLAYTAVPFTAPMPTTFPPGSASGIGYAQFIIGID